MRLIHYTSLEVNPWVHIAPGKNVFREEGEETHPGIYCVPDTKWFRHFWFDRRPQGWRNLMVILEVPDEFVRLSKMGKFLEHGSRYEAIKLKDVSFFCQDDDNAIVIKAEYDPSWVQEVNFCYFDGFQVKEEALDQSFWSEEVK